MEVRGKERVAFNFKDLLKSFVNTNDSISDDIEKELAALNKETDNKRINKYEAMVSSYSTKKTNSKKSSAGGTRGGKMKTQTVEAKQTTAKGRGKEAEEVER